MALRKTIKLVSGFQGDNAYIRIQTIEFNVAASLIQATLGVYPDKGTADADTTGVGVETLEIVLPFQKYGALFNDIYTVAKNDPRLMGAVDDQP